MEHRTKDDAQQENANGSSIEQESGMQPASAGNNKNTAPADRDAGSLEHGELGGNFSEESEGKEE